MIRYNGLAQDSTNGQALNGASVTVVEVLTGLNAALFADDGTTPLANPVTADSGGLYHFKIDAGLYTLTIIKGTYTEVEDLVTLIDDPSLMYLVNDDVVEMVDGDLVFVSGDGLVKKAVSTATDVEASVFAICVEAALNSSDTGRFRTFGVVKRAGTAGLLGYLGQSSEITDTVPEFESGDLFAVILGRQIRSAEFLLNPPGGGGVLELAPLAPVPDRIGDPSDVSVDGPVSDAWLDRVNWLYYIITGGTHITDSSGTYTISYAACLDLRTMLWTAWRPVLGNGSGHLWSDQGTSWIYISQSAGINGAPTGQTRRVDKTTGTTNDAGFSPTDTALVGFIENESGSIWGGTGHDYFGIIGLCEHYDSAGVTSPPGYVYTPGGGGYLPEAVAYAYIGSGLGLASAPASFSTHTGPSAYLAAGVAVFDTTTGLVVGATYGVSCNHARPMTDIVLGKAVVTGVFTDVVSLAALSTVQTVQGLAVMAADMSAFYPFSVTFTALDSTRAGGIDPDSGMLYGGGNIRDIDGDTSRHAVFAMNLDGTLNTAFNPIVTSGYPDVLAIHVIEGVVIVGGAWTGPQWNGVTKDNLVFLKAADGELYLG